MTKNVTEQLMELQSDMISIAYEYVDGQAEKIFVYGSTESGVIGNDFFYQVNGQLFHRYELNKLSSKYDTSASIQLKAIKLINSDLQKISSLCKENNLPIPTEFKLTYDVKSKNFNSDLGYETRYTHTDDLTMKMIVEQWFEEIKEETEN